MSFLLLTFLVLVGCTQPTTKPQLGPFFTTVNSPRNTGIGSSWSFIYRSQNQWFLSMSQKGDLWAVPLDQNLRPINPKRQNLTNNGILKDHALRKCTDGGFLLASSDHLHTPNWVYRFDQNFTLLADGKLAQQNPTHAANDIASICTKTFQGIGVAEINGERDYFCPIDMAANNSERVELENAPRMTGAGMMEYNEKLYVTGINPKMTVSIYDAKLQLLTQKKIPSIDPEIILYWATRIIPVGDYFVMLTMGRDPGRGWLFDTGDLYLAVLTQDFVPVHWEQLTAYDPKLGGGMRPWMDYHDGQLLVVYEKGKKIYLIEVSINKPAFER